MMNALHELSYQKILKFWVSFDRPAPGPFSQTLHRGGKIPWIYETPVHV